MCCMLRVTCHMSPVTNWFIYQARESSLVPTGFLTAQFLQETKFMKPLLLWDT